MIYIIIMAVAHCCSSVWSPPGIILTPSNLHFEANTQGTQVSANQCNDTAELKITPTFDKAKAEKALDDGARVLKVSADLSGIHVSELHKEVSYHTTESELKGE